MEADQDNLNENQISNESVSKPVLQRSGTKILSPVGTPEKSNQPQKRKSAVLARYPSYLLKHRKPISEIAGPNDWLEVYLPHDILLVIFMTLSRKDLLAASRVCKHWKSVSLDPYFGWAKICRIPLLVSGYSRDTFPEDAVLSLANDYYYWSESLYNVNISTS